MTGPKSDREFRFSQVYDMPGEGLIAEFRMGEETRLYNANGLRHRVMTRRAEGLDTREEDKALAILTALDRS